MKKIRKILSGISCMAIVMTLATPVLAYSPIKGWMTDGGYTGYPYLSWTEYGSLWGAVAAQNKSTNQLVDWTSGSGQDNLYVRTPKSKLYVEKTHKGFYDYRVK